MNTLPQFVRSNPLARFIRPFRRALLKKREDRRRLGKERDAFNALTDEDVKRVEFYSQFVKKNDLVFDVGANRGNRTKCFLKLGARVVAFEPQAGCADYLSRVLANEKRFRLLRQAVGTVRGEAKMMISSVDVLSSLNEEWIAKTKESGRFSSISWEQSTTVEITTLDAAIADYGVPAFIKIDVEGYEKEVISGLTRPIAGLSFEFTQEYLTSTFACIDHLAALGPIECQLSFDESMQFRFDSWVTPEELKKELSGVWPLAVGAVYVRRRS